MVCGAEAAAAEADVADGMTSALGRMSGPRWPQAATTTVNTSAPRPVHRRVCADSGDGCAEKPEAGVDKSGATTLGWQLFRMLNILATMTTPLLTDAEYLRLANTVLAAVERQIDGWLDADLIDIDTHRTGGLLELTFPDRSKIILNTQPPLQELWLAARGGGFHYRWQAGRWLDTRDGAEFFSVLSQHASTQAGQVLRFEAPSS